MTEPVNLTVSKNKDLHNSDTIRIQDGQAIHTEPVPDDAIVTSIGQVQDLLAKRGHLVIDRQDLIAIHRAFGYLQAAMEGAADAWNKIAESTGMDGLRA